MIKEPKRIISIFLAIVLSFSLAACKKMQAEPEQPADSLPSPEIVTQTPTVAAEPEDTDFMDEDYISAALLASSLKEKYTDSEIAVYQKPLWAVPENQEFYVDLEFSIIEDTEYDRIEQVFCVYADAELTKPISTTNEIITHEKDPSVPEGHNRLYIRPYRYPPGRVWGSYTDIITNEEIKLGGPYDYYLQETAPGETWGYLKHYYLALHVDTKTSETLDKPLVTIFTTENQLRAPQSKFYVNEDGYAAFSWEPVAGADYYLIARLENDDTTTFPILWPIDKVTETGWVHPKEPDGSTMNKLFRTRSWYPWSEDDMIKASPGEERKEAKFDDYTVIAVNGSTHSPVGTIHKGEEIAARLPYTEAFNTNAQAAEKVGGSFKRFPSVGLLPVKRAITMADGATFYRRMLYDFDSAEVKVDTYYSYEEGPDGEMTNIETIDSTNLYITYVVEGTDFTDYTIAEGINPNTWKKELAAKQRQQEDNVIRGGGMPGIGIESRSNAPGGTAAGSAPTEIPDRREEHVYANSALSEYLALNMLACSEYIDLTEFPESADSEYLLDAFQEALYQNPMILLVEGVNSVPGTNLIVVQYSEPRRTIMKKQKDIRKAVSDIIAEIITPGMSDSEKSYAINQYLTDTAEYDFAALENAGKNNYISVDAKFNDSFTAYGILINKIGVCAGYAAAYKLLADEAGLQAIVVTGYLEGLIPHAWNRVNINGQWYTLDVTNNDNEFLYNVIMHLPDKAARAVLVEDSMYVLDAFIDKFKSTDDSCEYYRSTGRFYGRAAIAAELAQLVRQNGSATLRTDYSLGDDAFYEIMNEVSTTLNSTELYGFYWLGVIWISK